MPSALLLPCSSLSKCSPAPLCSLNTSLRILFLANFHLPSVAPLPCHSKSCCLQHQRCCLHSSGVSKCIPALMLICPLDKHLHSLSSAVSHSWTNSPCKELLDSSPWAFSKLDTKQGTQMGFLSMGMLSVVSLVPYCFFPLTEDSRRSQGECLITESWNG